MMIRCLTLLFGALLCTCASAQKTNKPWTAADRAHYAHRNDDPAAWDSTMLAEDLEWHREPPYWPTQPAISSIPSPVAAYDWGYCALRAVELQIGEQSLNGYNVAYAKDAYRREDLTDSAAYYQSYFTILALTDWPERSNRVGHIVSRNYPHYLASGKFRTSTGDLDWVQMNLASGENFAIVSQRYFDLREGKTLLVAQQPDGSLRFRQLNLSPGAILRDGTVPGMDAYLAALRRDPSVAAFFDNGE